MFCPNCSQIYQINLDKVSSLSPVFRCQKCFVRFTFRLDLVDPTQPVLTRVVFYNQARNRNNSIEFKDLNQNSTNIAKKTELKSNDLMPDQRIDFDFIKWMNFYYLKIGLAVLFFVSCIFLIVLGLSMSQMNNLVGVGAALFSLFIGLLFLIKKQGMRI